MPLTNIQRKVLKLLAERRTPESYVGGATVLHRDNASPRFSRDIDFFHDVEKSIALSAETDFATLQENDIKVEWILQNPTFYRAEASISDERIKLEWAVDSAFRFFPVIRDPVCGYRLHEIDAAVNKILAMAGRREARDFVDILHIHKTSLSLGALAWAACGKDPGYTPPFLLNQANRNACYTQAQLDQISLSKKLDIKDLKRNWLKALEESRELVNRLPASEIGCLYLSSDGKPVTPDPDSSEFDNLKRHFGSLRGAWPTVEHLPDDYAGHR